MLWGKSSAKPNMGNISWDGNESKLIDDTASDAIGFPVLCFLTVLFRKEGET